MKVTEKVKPVEVQQVRVVELSIEDVGFDPNLYYFSDFPRFPMDALVGSRSVTFEVRVSSREDVEPAAESSNELPELSDEEVTKKYEEIILSPKRREKVEKAMKEYRRSFVAAESSKTGEN